MHLLNNSVPWHWWALSSPTLGPALSRSGDQVLLQRCVYWHCGDVADVRVSPHVSSAQSWYEYYFDSNINWVFRKEFNFRSDDLSHCQTRREQFMPLTWQLLHLRPLTLLHVVDLMLEWWRLLSIQRCAPLSLWGSAQCVHSVHMCARVCTCVQLCPHVCLFSVQHTGPFLGFLGNMKIYVLSSEKLWDVKVWGC